MTNKPTSHLPKSATRPTIDPRKSRILLYGGSGTGRSVFASQFPATYFDLAQTATYLEIMRYPVSPPDGWSPSRRGKRATAWQWFLDGIDACVRDPQTDMLVVDTIDRAFELCFDAVCMEHSIESPEDNMRRLRQTYGQINREFGRMLSRLRLFPGGLVLICNEEIVCRDQAGAIVDPSADNVATRRAEPSFKAKSPARHKLRGNLEELCGIIGRTVIASDGSRMLCISARDSLGKDRTGLLPSLLGLDYESFCEPFRKAYSAAPSE